MYLGFMPILNALCLALTDQFPIHRQPPTYLMDILLYSIFPRTQLFMSLLLFSTPQGIFTKFWGRCLVHHLTSHSTTFVTSIFPLRVSKHSFKKYFSFDSSYYFKLLNKKKSITSILTFLSEYFRKYNIKKIIFYNYWVCYLVDII